MTTDDRPLPTLARRLGTGDAVAIGLGSMIGAGVFSAFAPAARAAGTGLLIGLVLASGVAYCNAVASAQLAAQYPESGGTYVYGRRRLGDWWGFVAGWGFVTGKTASCAAMAITFAAYVAPDSTWGQRFLGVAAVVTLTAVNLRGITRTAVLSRVLVAASVAALAVAVVAILAADATDSAHLGRDGSWWSGGVYGVLQAAGLLFFAFAGYARIATLGEEVRVPERTIPRAILIALGITVVVYFVVGAALLMGGGPDLVAATPTPVATVVDAVGAAWAVPVVRVGAAVASLGALLALIAGVGRTALAMARQADLPRALGAVHPRYRVPHRAEAAVAVAVIALVLSTDVREVIGFSSFGVLVYYAIANAAAFTQTAPDRRWPRWLQVVGAAACVVLATTLPWPSVLGGMAVLALGVTARLVLGQTG